MTQGRSSCTSNSLRTRTRASRRCRWDTLLLPAAFATRQFINRTASLKHGYRMLEQAGNFNNLRLAIGQGEGPYSGKYSFPRFRCLQMAGSGADELGHAPDAELATLADQTIDLLRAVQLPDGYLNSYYQFHKPAERWTNLDNDHEMYCAGHLIEAGIAQRRATGQTEFIRHRAQVRRSSGRYLRPRQTIGRVRPSGDRTGVSGTLSGDHRSALSRSRAVLHRSTRTESHAQRLFRAGLFSGSRTGARSRERRGSRGAAVVSQHRRHRSLSGDARGGVA